MQKAIVVSVIVFLVSSGLLYGVFANSHIEIFPGEICENNYETGYLECESGLVSLLSHNRGVRSYGYDAMNGFGWVVLLLVNVGIPASGSILLAKKIGSAKKSV